MNFFQKIFSIKNNGNYKVIHLLGIKISINRIKSLKKLKIQNKIVFTNFDNNSFGCSPKYILNEILRQKLPYELVWLVKNPKKERKNFPKCVKLVKSSSIQALKEFSTAKFWITNTRLYSFIERGLEKKEGQIYIQTWHGALGIKQIEKDIEDNEGYKEYLKYAKIDSSYTDYLISPSEYDTKILKNCFYFDKEFLNIGYPRNDIFFLNEKEKNEKIKNIKNNLSIGQDKKILLYTPTFRDSHSIDVYDIDFDNLTNALKERFKKDFIVLIRLHPNISYLTENMKKKFKNVIDVTNYPDMQELLLLADVLITDYSSSIFDFMYQRKPIFIYANDIEEYYKERGFYLDIKKLFCPIAYNNKELIDNVKFFDEKDYIKKLNEHIKFRNSFDDGNASKRCVDIIKQIGMKNGR